MQPYLKIVGNGQRTARDLTAEEAEAAFTLIMEHHASLPQVAAFMAGLRIKEESAAELAVFGRVLRRYCQITPLDVPNLVDICVPYDGRSRQPSLIPAAALIAASGGARVALHGRCGQSTSPKFGLGVGDIFAALGIEVQLNPETAGELLLDDSIGVTYVDAAQFAPALEYFNDVRFDYGMRSFFNTIEKWMNPFNAPAGIVGVFHGPVLERVALAMQKQGYEHGLAVQGTEGAMDVLTTRRTPIIEFDATENLRSWVIDPADYGGWTTDDKAKFPVSAETNATLTQQILDPHLQLAELASFRQSALLTAALILYTADQTMTFTEALATAQLALNSGDALMRLTRWQAMSMREVHYAG